MNNRKSALNGQQAEQRAVVFLKQQGLKIIERNYLMSGGEIDIIARDQQTLVFVEVRFRQNSSFGSPLETIDRKKQQRIIKAATHYLQRHSLWDKIACRFDTLCITVDNTCRNSLKLDWQRNAFNSN